MQEKRRQDRAPVSMTLDVSDVNTGTGVGRVVNLSSEGLMLVADRCIPLNAVFQFSVALPRAVEGRDRLHFGAESLWCHPTNDGQHYWTGFHIIDLSAQDQELLARLLQEF